MQSLPKSRIKRFFWHLRPAHLKEYWWSRDGAIMALKIGGIGILAVFVLMMGTFAFFRKDLDNIKNLGGNLDGSISYYDRTGKLLLFQDYNAVKRVPVQSNEISKYIKDATIATEDRGFYSEPGFSVKGIARAVVKNVTHGGVQEGGSTISQQLVKMTMDWTQNRTFTRKVKELILAVDLERTYSKDEILTAYLNVAPYGGVDYGVQAAASDYFHTSAEKLTLPQAAMLAAIPKSPSYYSPYGPYYDKAALVDRYEYVLDSMVETHYISQEQANSAKKVAVYDKVFKQQTKYAGIKHPYFVLAAKNQLETEILHPGGETKSSKVGGWKVVTSMDVDLQKLAEKSTNAALPMIKARGGDTAAFVAEDVKTGQMVAVVGGQDFTASGYGQINFAQWPISPGSSFKPYDYTALIENNNAGAGSVLYDSVSALPGYPCTNKASPLRGGNCLQDYDFRSPGPMTLRYALGGSRNIPAVKAMLQADPNDRSAPRVDSVNKTIDTAEKLMHAPDAYNCFSDDAMTKKTQCYGSAALGDGAFLHLDQHVNGLASLARMGVSIPTTYILKIYDANNKVIPGTEWKQPKGEQVVRPDSAYIVNDMAADPRASYLPGSCTASTCTPLSAGGYKFQRYNGWHFAVKTGTTGNSFDGLMTSWSTQYAAAAWVGYHTRNRELNAFMEVLTEPITRPWMEGAHDLLKKNPVNWTQPSDIQTLPAYVLNHKISRNGEIPPSPSKDIFPSWYRPRTAATGSSTIDKVSGKEATDCTPTAARQTISGSASANLFSIDIFFGGGIATSSQSGKDDVHQCSDAKPRITSINVTPLSGGQYQLEATATAGTHPLTGGKFGGTIQFSIDGEVVGTGNMNSSGRASINFTNTKYSGSRTVTATVADSVLYEASGSRTATFTKAPSSLKFTSAEYDSGTLNVHWSGGNGPYTAAVGAQSCSAPSGATSCEITGAPPSGSVTITDSDSGQTASGSY